MKKIYLDYNATTPIDPLVADTIDYHLKHTFGNPSSAHTYGEEAKSAVEKAREELARLIGCSPEEIIFTSGGTESDNMAIKGTAWQLRHKGQHIIISNTEHPAVEECCRWLEHQGFEISRIPVDSYGKIIIEEVIRAIRKDTILMSVMHANNETGTIQPIEEIAKIANSYGILFHTDAAQSCGKIEVNVEKLGVDLLTVAGHKMYAPKGIGALYIRKGTDIQKIIHGASHERNLRAGTENTPYICGLGKACELASVRLAEESQKIRKMSDYLWKKLKTDLPEIRLNGHPSDRLPNTLSIGFPEVEAEHFLKMAEKIAASAGAACHAGQTEISAVLKAMSVPDIYAKGTIRLSLGRFTTQEEIDEAIDCLTTTYRKMTGSVRKIRRNILEAEKGTPEIKTEILTKSEIIRKEQQLSIGEFPGCSCKVKSSTLSKILPALKGIHTDFLLNRSDTNEDACVYQISENLAIVQSVDFFPAVVNNPYDFGAIAAANSLSDIYAMGSQPLFALSILSFPENYLNETIIQEILRGAADKCMEAGISIVGGHTINDETIKFGLVVTGQVHPDKVLLNSTAKPGNFLFLTKPIGTGIILNGIERQIVTDKIKDQVVETMKTLNKWPDGILEKYSITSCTDVTGFGLLGHLSEMTKASEMDAEIWYDAIPLFPQLMDIMLAGAHSCTAQNNLRDIQNFVEFDDHITDAEKSVLADAQTSGGLLISVPEPQSSEFKYEMQKKGISCSLIGWLTKKGTGKISVKRKMK